MGQLSFDAVIFDLDGVITKTALVHGTAWKEAFDEYLQLREKRDGESFREFTHENDYLPHVDGKPRYEGVKSFLESRDINIPFGDPSDPPEKETVCGIGNRKNKKFLELLEKKGPEVYSSTVKFMRDLKARDVRIGVASSSKNCRQIIKAAGIEDLFETRVDGVVSDELGLKGKPEGDIFETAALNVGSTPAKSVVVEDATSGVLAGRNGAFGLVLGVAREGNEEALFYNGADVVVPDMEYIDPEWIERWFRKKPRSLFDCWDLDQKVSTPLHEMQKENLAINPCYFKSGREAIFNGRKPMFFLDYDGTLTPIVDRPELAVISEEMRDVVRRIAEKYTVAIVSGRSKEVVEDLVRLKDIFYVGDHGVDIKGPGVSMIYPRAREAMEVLAASAKSVSERLGDIPGLLIEAKGFSVSVHYRLVEEKHLNQIAKTVNSEVKGNDRLRLMFGKKVLEIIPAIDWDKGKAVRWIMRALGFSGDSVSVIYIGDDTTDENAFRIVRTRGTPILVSEESQVSAADFQVDTPKDVRNLLIKVLEAKI